MSEILSREDFAAAVTWGCEDPVLCDTGRCGCRALLAHDAALRASNAAMREALGKSRDLLSSAKHRYRSDSPMRAAIEEFLARAAEGEGKSNG